MWRVAPAILFLAAAQVPVALAQPARHAPTPQSFTLAQLEQMALRGNPTLPQAAARVQSADARAFQAGLRPNPIVGYTSDEVGVDRSAGFHGGFIQQTIIRGGKLERRSNVFLQEAAREQAIADAQRQRVINGVRIRFFDVLANQQLVEVRRTLHKNAEKLQETATRLKNNGKLNRPEELMAIIATRQAGVALTTAENAHQASWRDLAAFVAQPNLPVAKVEGNLEQGGRPLSRRDTLTEVLGSSPELQIARAEVARQQAVLDREQAEPVPNLNLRLGAQYSFETRDPVALVELGFALPIFNRNQGGISAAYAELTAATAQLQQVELSLRNRHANAFAQFETAKAQVESYQLQLSDATEAFGLYQEAFQLRRVSYQQLLLAQRMFYQLNVDYINALRMLRRSEVVLSGMLLVDDGAR